MWQPCATRVDVSARGFDDSLCGICSLAGQVGPGLRIPTVASTSTATSYVFQLCTLPLDNQPWWLVSLTQFLEIGLDSNAGTPPVYPLVQRVGGPGGNPGWRFSDARVNWHLRLVRGEPAFSRQTNALDTDSFMNDWSVSPALLYRTATFPANRLNAVGTPDRYMSLTAYTAPSVRGEDVEGLGTWSDIRFPEGVDGGRSALEPVRLVGPGYLVLYGVVWQTNTSTRATITIPAKFPLSSTPGMAEEAFVANFTSAQYWRIGGSLIVERRRSPP